MSLDTYMASVAMAGRKNVIAAKLLAMGVYGTHIRTEMTLSESKIASIKSAADITLRGRGHMPESVRQHIHATLKRKLAMMSLISLVKTTAQEHPGMLRSEVFAQAWPQLLAKSPIDVVDEGGCDLSPTMAYRFIMDVLRGKIATHTCNECGASHTSPFGESALCPACAQIRATHCAKCGKPIAGRLLQKDRSLETEVHYCGDCRK